MIREEAKKFLPIIQAFAEGKDIEYYNTYYKKWELAPNPTFNIVSDYRIKLMPKYCPFKDRDECYETMLYHKPFGCVTDGDYNYCVSVIYDEDAYFDVYIGNTMFHFDEAFDKFKFIDGTPFEIEEV